VSLEKKRKRAIHFRLLFGEGERGEENNVEKFPFPRTGEKKEGGAGSREKKKKKKKTALVAIGKGGERDRGRTFSQS